MESKNNNNATLHAQSRSLRMTLVRTIAGVLLLTLLLSAVLTYWNAMSKVETEVGSAIDMAEKTVRKAIPDIARDDDPRLELVRLVRVFDGNRHVKASFVEANSGKRISSTVAPVNELPEWFFKLFARPPEVVRVELPDALASYGSFELETSLRGEVAEVWDDVVLKLTILTVFCVLASVLVYITIGRALGPITGLLGAFERLGNGDYRARVEAKGPTEIEKLCGGFNAMAQRLGDMETRNRRLNEQLATVQEEERADLARDLHDEVSPFLFSVDVDASTIRQIASGPEASTVTARADAIRDAAAHMKKHVKSILNRLRPTVHLDLGLKNAIETLVASWQLRNPDVSFKTEIAEGDCGVKIDGVIHGIVREAISNALKHGKPEEIDVTVEWEGEDFVTVVVRDDGGGLKPTSLESGFGLIAMRERTEALGGTVTVQNRSGLAGVEVTARIPVGKSLAAMDDTHELDVSP
jgi:two-component system, NarL family, sensor histidine kinase UhpB